MMVVALVNQMNVRKLKLDKNLPTSTFIPHQWVALVTQALYSSASQKQRRIQEEVYMNSQAIGHRSLIARRLTQKPSGLEQVLTNYREWHLKCLKKALHHRM